MARMAVVQILANFPLYWKRRGFVEKTIFEQVLTFDKSVSFDDYNLSAVWKKLNLESGNQINLLAKTYISRVCLLRYAVQARQSL